MAISDAYQDTLKRRAIKRFIDKWDRSPTQIELRDLVRREFRRYPSVDEVGISGSDIKKPQFSTPASASVENTNRHALFDDMTTINTRIDDMVRLLEDGYRGFQATVRRTRRLLSQVESRADNLLLLQGDVDVFVTGFEETFDTQEHIDFDRTNASVESGYCTLGRTGFTPLDLSEAKILVTASAERGFISVQQTENIEFLKEDDGSVWEYLVYTKNKQGRVSMVLDVELPEPAFISDLRFTANPIGVNRLMTVTVFYSLDGKTFTALEPVESVVTQEENFFNIGLDDVQRVRLLFSKEAADNETVTADQFVYLFSLDSIKIHSDLYLTDAESTLIAGPYDVVDEEGNPVFFTKATCEACTVEDEETSVNISLSKDGANWIPVNHRAQSLAVASFNNSASAGTFGFIDDFQGEAGLVEEAVGFVEIDFSQEALINKCILEEFADTVPVKSILIKRNVVTTEGIADVYNVQPGWYFDPNTGLFTTTVYIDAPEGRRIDVGPSGALVNGNLLTGEIHLKTGYTVFSTSDSNWVDIPSGIVSLKELRKTDPLYPYNHKHLIEGYRYADTFAGERVYNGVDEYFGRLLQYIPPEQFNAPESDTNLGVFTIDDSNGHLYFKVKVDKTDASWINERYEADWMVQNDTTNQLFVRAILTATEATQSPVIKSFSIRVI
jgi:hypothetical protein